MIPGLELVTRPNPVPDFVTTSVAFRGDGDGEGDGLGVGTGEWLGRVVGEALGGPVLGGDEEAGLGLTVGCVPPLVTTFTTTTALIPRLSPPPARFRTRIARVEVAALATRSNRYVESFVSRSVAIVLQAPPETS
jgi:hypothetical protein